MDVSQSFPKHYLNDAAAAGLVHRPKVDINYLVVDANRSSKLYWLYKSVLLDIGNQYSE